MLGNSQHGFIKKQTCQTNQISFFDRVTALVDMREARDVIPFLLEYKTKFFPPQSTRGGGGVGEAPLTPATIFIFPVVAVGMGTNLSQTSNN